jgi:hypothetical protein
MPVSGEGNNLVGGTPKVASSFCIVIERLAIGKPALIKAILVELNPLFITITTNNKLS